MEIKVISSMDKTEQPSLFFPAKSQEKRPLIVGLHSWSYDRFNQEKNMLPYAQKNDFHLLLPNFRGPNLATNPEYKKACGSEYAIQDVFDAIEYVKENFAIDEQNIFLIGVSGGGHMSLLCTAKQPKTFRAIASVVPICDLERWSRENQGYGKHVLDCCDEDVEEMKKRSPISYIGALAQANLKIFHGKFDKVVPYKQSYDLYAEIIKTNPDARVFLDIFDGGHQMNLETIFAWILSQYQKENLNAVTG